VRSRSLLALFALPALLAGCAAEQPAHCDAFLKCFYSDEGVTSPDTIEGRTEFQDLAVKEDAEAAFGPEGECWANGPEDPLYDTCADTCVGIVEEECDLALGGATRPCIEDDGNGGLQFRVQGMAGPIACSSS
jgi:hypothetical protein